MALTSSSKKYLKTKTETSIPQIVGGNPDQTTDEKVPPTRKIITAIEVRTWVRKFGILEKEEMAKANMIIVVNSNKTKEPTSSPVDPILNPANLFIAAQVSICKDG